MRKRIAVFANGWGSEYLREIGRGVSRYSAEQDTDIFAFVNYSAYSETKVENIGEFNIFMLPDIRQYDGVILLTNSFNLQMEVDFLQQKVLESGVPAVSLEYELDGMNYIGTDNYSGMYDLTAHMITHHNVKNILYIGGFREHPECQTRLKAVLDAAADHQIVIDEDAILYGDWSAASAEQCLEQWLAKGRPLPDAVICANDLMAVAACDWLTERGYRVPEDVKVTGYDCINQAREHEPAITTVNRGWDDLGYQAAELVMNRSDKKKQPIRMKLTSRLVCGGSCGCCDEEYESKVRSGHGRNYSVRMDGVETDRHFRHLYMAVRKDETADEFSKSLSAFYCQEGWMEGKNFALYLNPDFFNPDEQDEYLKKPGYGNEMDMICSLKNGEPEEYGQITLSQALFRAAERSKEAGTYLFVPLHSEDKHFGFAMLTRDFDIAMDKLLYIWTRHMGQYIEQVRSNARIAELTRRLSVLSVTDVLTGIYNRAGCEKIIYPFLQECQQKGGRGIVMIADIDRMKIINDRYGHGQGDLALKISAEVLRQELPEGFLIARFGGDEFLIAGEKKEGISLEAMIERITKRIASEAKLQNIPFHLTLSIGGVILKRGESFELNECLQKADEYMYQMKEVHHKKIKSVKV